LAAKDEKQPVEKNWMTGKDQQPRIDRTPSPESQALAATNEKPKRYVVGLDSKCPFDYITVPTIPREGGAFTFQKSIQKTFEAGDGMLALSGPVAGEVIEIYQDEHAKIVEYLTNYGVKRTGSNPEEARPEIVPLKAKEGQRHNRREVAQGHIEPLSKYAYIVPAREVTAEDQESANRPPTLLEAATAPVASK